MDLTIFPTQEEWGTGDEAQDYRLSSAFKQTTLALSHETIASFYYYGMSIKTRAHNPTFFVTIELVTKALFYFLNPLDCIDDVFKKMKGDYFHKTKTPFVLEEKNLILEELKKNKYYRYKNQIDFSLQLQTPCERNPYVKDVLKRSTLNLNAKFIFKDFKNMLKDDPFFLAFKEGENLLLIEDFAEIWYHQDQLFMLSDCKGP